MQSETTKTRNRAPFGQTSMMKRIRDLQDRVTKLVQERAWIDARKQATTLRRLEPENLIALETLARANWHLGEGRKTLEILRTLRTINPHEPGYLTLEGACHERLGQFAAAAGAYGQALKVESRAGSRADIMTRLATLELAALATAQRAFSMAEPSQQGCRNAEMLS